MKLKCPNCNGESELAGEYISQCFFCGHTFPFTESNKLPKDKLEQERKKLKLANQHIGLVEINCPYSLNFPHIAKTFGEEYANDLKIICEQIKSFREKYRDIYDINEDGMVF